MAPKELLSADAAPARTNLVPTGAMMQVWTKMIVWTFFVAVPISEAAPATLWRRS
jgi:hypothetical protein